MVIEVINWQKFNPRGNERKKFHYHWFRLSDEIFDDPQFAEFSAADFAVFIYVLAMTCRKQGKPWVVIPSFCAARARVSVAEFNASIRKLLELNIVLQKDTKSAKIVHTLQDTTLQDTTQQGERTYTAKQQNDPPLTTNVCALTPKERAPNIVDLWNKNRAEIFHPCLALSVHGLKEWVRAWNKNPREKYWVALIKRAATETWLTDPNRAVPVTLAWFLKHHDEIELGEHDRKSKKPQRVFEAKDFR